LASKDSDCPYCTNKLLCDNKNCDICLQKSFAVSPKAKYWSKKNNDIKPRDVFISTGKGYWFECDECSHKFKMRLDYIRRGNWCSYCSNQKLCNNDNCMGCFVKSFASSPKAEFWSKKNEKTPREVFKCSGIKYFFNCDKCEREFDSSLDHITGNKWCPFCINKTEGKLFSSLLQFYPQLKRSYKVNWCKKDRHLPFDFVLEDLKILIELDGPQHFKQVSNWQAPEKTQEIDKYKIKCANNNNFYLIRILQEDVFNDRYNWLEELKQNINKIKGNPKNIYMCKNNEYNFIL
jgi:Marseilleviridae restriction endonuclease